jgi:chorismate mutase
MTFASRNHLARIDLALVQLLQERARITQSQSEDAHTTTARVEDLLRRTEGPFDSGTLTKILQLAAEGCGGKR